MNKAITKGGRGGHSRRFSFKCANRPAVVQSGRDGAQSFVPVRFVLYQRSYMPTQPEPDLQPHLTELHLQETSGDKSNKIKTKQQQQTLPPPKKKTQRKRQTAPLILL